MAAIESVRNDNRDPEVALVLEELNNASPVSENYTTRLLSFATSTPAAFEAGKIIKGLATARRLVAAGQAIIEVAREQRADSETAMSLAESELRQVRDTLPVPDRSPDPADILRRVRQKTSQYGTSIRFLPSLHNITGGMIPGHLWVVGGASSTGKSAFACNIIRDAIENRRWVGLISTEMTQENYLERMIALMANVPFQEVRNKVIVGHDKAEAIREAESFLSRSPLRVFDTIYRLQDIRLQATVLKETVGLDVLLVDFIQNVRGTTGDYSFSDLTEIALALQEIAKELKCTVVAFSQISNEMLKYQQESNDDNYYAFKGSGAIKDAADLAIMLRRDRIKQSSALTVQVLKNRHGSLLTVPAYLDLPTGNITEAEPEFIDN